MHSPGPSPADVDSCYEYFGSKDDPLTSTLVSLALTPKTNNQHSTGGYASPDASDNECEADPLEDVRRKRQSMARMQTNDDILRQLGELVKRVSPSSSRKGSATSLVESSGVVKRSSNNCKIHHRSRSRSKTAKSRETNGSGRRIAT
jgi:hypothetical protein